MITDKEVVTVGCKFVAKWPAMNMSRVSAACVSLAVFSCQLSGTSSYATRTSTSNYSTYYPGDFTQIGH